MKDAALSERVDPELAKQINEAAADEAVGAVIRLSPPTPESVSPSPEETDRIAHKLLSRAQKRAKLDAPDYNVFRNLGYFVVSAPPAYLRALVDEPEVARAFPNKRKDTGAE